jgi:L-ribulose-5-phosphate 3-epimerase
MFKIGVIVDSFCKPLHDAVATAKEIGADGISLYAVTPEFNPDSMSYVARAEFKAWCNGIGIEIASLVGELGGHGFERADDNKLKIPKLKRIVDFAADLGTTVVTTHIGVIPSDRNSRRYDTMLSACADMGAYAAGRGVSIGIETGPEPPKVLKRFLEDLNSPGMGVNLDPANLVMVQAEDPVKAVHVLAPYIVSTHAKDGRNLQECNPEVVYAAFADGGFEELLARTGKLFEELPLGQGDVPWKEYLNALHGCGFKGYLTVEREVGDEPCSDIADAVFFLKALIGDSYACFR